MSTKNRPGQQEKAADEDRKDILSGARYEDMNVRTNSLAKIKRNREKKQIILYSASSASPHRSERARRIPDTVDMMHVELARAGPPRDVHRMVS